MASSDLIAEAMKRRTGKAWFWLYEVELQTDATESRWALLTSHDQDVTFDSLTYYQHRVSFDRIASGSPGDLASLDLRISNVGGLASQYLRQYDGLDGRRAIVRLVAEDYLSDPADTVPHSFEILDSSAGIAQARLVLGHMPLHKLGLPAGTFTRDVCGSLFRGPRCGWTTALGGDATACDFSLDGPNGCASHNNVPRFGGTPSLPAPE